MVEVQFHWASSLRNKKRNKKLNVSFWLPDEGVQPKCIGLHDQTIAINAFQLRENALDGFQLMIVPSKEHLQENKIYLSPGSAPVKTCSQIRLF